MDERLRQSWLGHPYLVVVDNSTGFDEKLARVVDVVQNRSGHKGTVYLIAVVICIILSPLTLQYPFPTHASVDGRAETDFIKRKFLLKKVGGATDSIIINMVLLACSSNCCYFHFTIEAFKTTPHPPAPPPSRDPLRYWGVLCWVQLSSDPWWHPCSTQVGVGSKVSLRFGKIYR